MRALIAAIVVTLTLVAPARADELRLGDLEAVHAACRASEGGVNAELYSVTVDSPWHFASVDDDLLPVDTARNLRAFAGSVQLLPSRMEEIGFVANEERAATLEAARAQGATLRVGFFLGFDDPERSSCLIRPRQAVTMVRMDVAYLELVDADGAVIAREDTERYRSWHDDSERTAIPGVGPRARVEPANIGGSAAPDAWQRAIATAAAGTLGTALATCHREGIARGAEAEATIRVRLTVEGRTGHVTQSGVEIANVGDTDEIECIETALEHVELPAAPGELASRTVELVVPISLVN
jgi:hypothetical protein